MPSLVPEDLEVAKILGFWFEELEPRQWFEKDAAVDETIRTRFAQLFGRLKSSVPLRWRATPRGALATVIALDQFPRNLFRDDARAFQTDPQALGISRFAIEQGLDRRLNLAQRQFLYMPFQHSEDPAIQATSVELFSRLGDPQALDFAKRHKDIIDRFGRFPHRNLVLGRQSTPEERQFLESPGLKF